MPIPSKIIFKLQNHAKENINVKHNSRHSLDNYKLSKGHN